MKKLLNSSGLLIGLILVFIGVVGNRQAIDKGIQASDRFWWQPKNQTYYYSLNTEKLQELADNFKKPESAETIENSVSKKTQKLSNLEIKDTKFFEQSKNNTKNTSIENITESIIRTINT